MEANVNRHMEPTVVKEERCRIPFESSKTKVVYTTDFSFVIKDNYPAADILAALEMIYTEFSLIPLRMHFSVSTHRVSDSSVEWVLRQRTVSHIDSEEDGSLDADEAKKADKEFLERISEEIKEATYPSITYSIIR